MMNIRQRSVNVSRLELLAKLKENLEIHRREYQLALVEFHERLAADLKLALKKVNSTTNTEDLKAFKFSTRFPGNHEQDYLEVIEMLEMSVDEHINLDAESFRAYIKNEWSWQNSFKAESAMYKMAGSFITV